MEMAQRLLARTPEGRMRTKNKKQKKQDVFVLLFILDNFSGIYRTRVERVSRRLLDRRKRM